ncbi:MAG: hypothetical protein KGJ93_00360 [Patescibacteria group bacterium]|nr:hypothetical protein [Patescibacteria group bacterium]
MNTRRIKWIVALAIAALLGYCIYLVVGQKSEPVQPAPAANMLNVPAQGGSIPVQDFTKHPVAALNGTDVIAQNNDYSIVYFTKEQSFLITILSQPAAAVRQAAEQELLRQLQIREADACRLNVSLTVPAAVDANLAGKDYGLSFCPSGLSFSLPAQ